ncbi:MAG: hypothetical protein HFG53_01755 [Lachnospiraceae bacterium]|jgi:hypothetical protein|nr:hypothetical protein [Lachnospiraceae bacterium]
MINQIKVAYLLLVHNNPKQLNIFINQLLNNGDCDIYIHIDRKNREIEKEIVQNSHIHIYSIYEVKWGSFEIIKASIYLMRKAIKSNIQYTHFYFGSGQDLLVKKGLYKYLSDHPKDIFINVYNEVNDMSRIGARYRVCWPKILMKRNDVHIYRLIRFIIQILCSIGIVMFPNRHKLRKGIRIYTGSTWFLGTYDLLCYIIQYLDNNCYYMDFWKNSLASDLMFFHTIIMNSEYSTNIVGDIVYKKWGATLKSRNHPVIIEMKNIKEIEESDFYFARKFDMSVDYNVISYYYKSISYNVHEEKS